MAGVAFVTGADRGLGLAITAQLLENGWRVFAGQYLPGWPELTELAARYPEQLTTVPLDVSSRYSVRAAAETIGALTDRIDLLISNAGVNSRTSPRTIREEQDYDEMRRLYEVNALGGLRVVEAFLPLLDRGTLKRLCFVSSEAGSVERAYRTSWFGYCMSKAAINMAVKLLFNDLRPQGYSFRLYHPGWVRGYLSGTKNVQASLEPEEAAVPALAHFLGERDDEDQLAMYDWEGKRWPW